MATIEQLIKQYQKQQEAEDAQNLHQATTRIKTALHNMDVDGDQYKIIKKKGMYYAEFELGGWVAYFGGFYSDIIGHIVDADGECGKTQSWDNVDTFDIAAAIEYMKREHIRNKERWGVIVVSSHSEEDFESECEDCLNNGYEMDGNIAVTHLGALGDSACAIQYTAVMKKRLQ